MPTSPPTLFPLNPTPSVFSFGSLFAPPTFYALAQEESNEDISSFPLRVLVGQWRAAYDITGCWLVVVRSQLTQETHRVVLHVTQQHRARDVTWGHAQLLVVISIVLIICNKDLIIIDGTTGSVPAFSRLCGGALPFSPFDDHHLTMGTLVSHGQSAERLTRWLVDITSILSSGHRSWDNSDNGGVKWFFEKYNIPTIVCAAAARALLLITTAFFPFRSRKPAYRPLFEPAPADPCPTTNSRRTPEKKTG
ncbi:hypothetical protein EDB89DRAFT_1904065 [Lactarius sanguifluus]|nr:hypothetical protein EDB89DRAFT_1904065 [Lactarius sanguifluus]